MTRQVACNPALRESQLSRSLKRGDNSSIVSSCSPCIQNQPASSHKIMPVLLVPAAILAHKLYKEHRQRKREQLEAQQQQEDVEAVVFVEGSVGDGDSVAKEQDPLSVGTTPSEDDDSAPTSVGGQLDEISDGPLRSVKNFIATANERRKRRNLSRAFQPFLRVNKVAPESPAALAGITEGDLIIRFGNTTHLAEDPVAEIAAMVPQAAAQKIAVDVVVLDCGEETGTKKVRLEPQEWNGDGLIGFHVVPC